MANGKCVAGSRRRKTKRMWSDHKVGYGASDECFEHGSEDNCLELEEPVFKCSRENESKDTVAWGGTEQRVGSAIVRMRTPRNLRQGILRNGGALAAF